MKRLNYLLFAGVLLGTVLSTHAQAVWTLRNAALPVRTLRGVTSTGAQLVAVGDTGTILTSTTGAAWTLRPSGTTNILFSVAAGPNLLVAVGAQGTLRVSADAATWTTVTSTATGAFYGAAYGGGKFVAVGLNGAVFVSDNGTEWVSRPSGVSATLRAVTYANGQFVAVGDAGVVTGSTDGVNWTGRTMGTGITTAFYGITGNNGTFMAVGAGGRIRTSPDGATWTAQDSKVTSGLNSVHHVDGSWIVVGDGGVLLTSPNGTDWTTKSSSTTNLLLGVSSLGGTRVTVGGAGTVRVSADGTTWENPLAGANNLNSVAWSPTNGYVAVGDASSAYVSSNGVTWTRRSMAASGNAAGVTSAGGAFVAVGGLNVQTSATGSTWNAISPAPATKPLSAIAYSSTLPLYVAVAGEGKYLTSPDGITWTERTSPVNTNLNSVTWGNGQFVIVGAGGVMLVSSNGTSWTSRGSSAFTGNLNSVAWADSQSMYVAVGAGAIFTSTTGTSWTARTSPVSSTVLYGVGNTGRFVTAVGANGSIIASQDGITWKTQPSGISTSLYSVTASDSLIVAVGVGGVAMTAPKAALPSVPAQVSPNHLATGVPVFPNLTWSAAANATSYRVQVSTDSSFASTLVNDSVSGTSWNALKLAGFTTYYWRVAGVSSLGVSAYSSKRSFTTGAAPTAPPATPTLISPALFATGVAIPVTLTWSAPAGTELYRVQVSTVSNFSTFLLNDSMVSTPSRQLTNLVGGTNYYWRVSARNSLGSSAFTETSMFQTLLTVPGKPTLLTPGPFETNVNRATSMTWSPVTGAAAYKIQVSLASTFATLLLQDTALTGTSYKPPTALAASTDFFWRVSAKNAAGTGEWSTAAKFTTGTVSALAGGPRLARYARVGGDAMLRFALSEPERVRVRLYDSQGRLLAVLLDENRPVGEHALRIPANLGSSLHFLEFRSGEGREWLKLHP